MKAYAYDSALTLAIAFNKTDHYLKMRGYSLLNVTNNKRWMMKIISQMISKSDFMGITVNIYQIIKPLVKRTLIKYSHLKYALLNILLYNLI